MLKLKNIKPTSVILLLLLTFSAGAQIETRRILSQNTYQINEDAKLSIIHKFGTITIKNHASNKITAEVAANIKAESEAAIEKILGNITLLMSGNEEGLKVETIFDDNLAGSKKNSATIDIIIQMPDFVDVSIDHKFGKTMIENLAGASNINCAYGLLDIKSLENGSHKIKVLQSSLKIETVSNSNIKSEHSSLSIGHIGDGKIESVFSTIHCNTAENLRLTIEGGKVELGSVDQLRISSNFATLEISQLNTLLDVKSEYTNIIVSTIDKSFNKVAMDATYSTIELNFGSDPAFQLTGLLEFSKIDFPENEWGGIVKSKDGQAIRLTGSTGSGQPTATVKLNSTFSTFRLR